MSKSTRLLLSALFCPIRLCAVLNMQYVLERITHKVRLLSATIIHLNILHYKPKYLKLESTTDKLYPVWQVISFLRETGQLGVLMGFEAHIVCSFLDSVLIVIMANLYVHFRRETLLQRHNIGFLNQPLFQTKTKKTKKK